jgi:hypothetical protein
MKKGHGLLTQLDGQTTSKIIIAGISAILTTMILAVIAKWDLLHAR